MSTPNEKIGILLETCDSNLSEFLTADKLASMLSDEQGVFVIDAPSWSDAGSVQRIQGVCADKELNHLVICGPSPESSQVSDWIQLQDQRVAVPVVHAAIRDQVSVADEEKTLEKIERLVRMAIARVRSSSPIEVMEKSVSRKVLVIGGNHAAMETSRTLALAGMEVVLVESEPSAGCVYPLSDELLGEVHSAENIEVIKGASVEYVDGGLGDFHVELRISTDRRYLQVGEIVVAVDLDILDGPLLPGLDDDERVVSLRIFGQQVKDKTGPSDSVCILLDQKDNERLCAAKAAVAFAYEHAKAGGKATIVARHMPVYGTQGQEIYDQARLAGVRFLRVDKDPVIESSSDCLSIEFTDTVLPDKKLALQVDRIVVPASMGPSERLGRLAHVLHQPRDLMGYLQSGNVRHRPVGSARRGVFFVGGCHDQCDPVQAASEAQAVAGQVLSELPSDTVLVPAEKIIYDTGHCARCLNCVRSCPHGAIHPDAEGHWVELLDPACWQCGICASVCPGLALEHGRLRFDQMHRTLHVAAGKLEKSAPVVAFACRQGAIRAADDAVRHGLSLPHELLIVDVPCAGLVSDRILLDAIEQGARGVMVLGCHHDNCRSLWGADLTRSRVDVLRQKLSDLGIEKERICFHPVAANEAFRLVHLLNDAMDEFPAGRPLEPGPFRETSTDEHLGQEVSHG